MLVALNSLAAAASAGTETLLDKLAHLLNYAATHSDAVLRYSAIDMQLWVHSDTSYLSESKARSRRGGYFYLSSKLEDPTKAPGPDDPPPPNNGAILVQTHIMKEVVPSAAECEFGGQSSSWRSA